LENLQRGSEAIVYTKVFFLAVASFFASILTYVGIDKEAFAIFTALVVIDFATGVTKAWYIGEHITSNKAKYGVFSKISLLLIPIVIAAAAKAIGADAKTFFVWALNLLIISEAYSIMGNIYSIRSKKELPEWDVISIIGKKIRDTFGGVK